MIDGLKIAVVLPAYNASRTLERTYAEIPMDIVDDVILVDGRARAQCAWFALPYLRRGTGAEHARTVVHDWRERAAYHSTLQLYDIMELAGKDTESGMEKNLVALAPKTDEPFPRMKRLPKWWTAGTERNEWHKPEDTAMEVTQRNSGTERK